MTDKMETREKIDAAISRWAGESWDDLDLLVYLFPSAQDVVNAVRDSAPDALDGIDDNAIADRVCKRLYRIDDQPRTGDHG